LGDAARHRVMSEFGRESFARRLLEAYGLPLAEPSDDVAVQPAVHAATQA
jgi:hypothetical protein